jgi:hypothetical protein
LDEHGQVSSRRDCFALSAWFSLLLTYYLVMHQFQGFWYGPRRGNHEDLDNSGISRLDPMEIKGKEYRDYVPKRGLDDKYIGDRYPLCTDLPDQPFLKKGAKFRLLGGSKSPRWQEDFSSKDTVNVKQHISLNATSSDLFTILCNEGNNGSCEYNSTVVLDYNLACDVGLECELENLLTVEVNGIYYGKYSCMMSCTSLLHSPHFLIFSYLLLTFLYKNI